MASKMVYFSLGPVSRLKNQDNAMLWIDATNADLIN